MIHSVGCGIQILDHLGGIQAMEAGISSDLLVTMVNNPLASRSSMLIWQIAE
jgi:hypothetical protein